MEPTLCDHDLLIVIKTQLDQVKTDIKEIKDNTAVRIAALENEKVEKEIFDRHAKENHASIQDHEKRIKRLERYGAFAAGILVILQIIFNKMVI